MSPPNPPRPSASAIAVTATTATHILKISGYSHGKLFLSAGNWIQSAKVEAAGQSWSIRLYPNGCEREESSGYISLFLELASECKQGIHARFGVSLVSHGGKLAAEQQRGRVGGGPVTFASTNRCFGFRKAIRKEDLEKPEYLKDDTILIRCDIAVLNKPIVAPQDLDSLQLLCHCKDDLCKNLHAIDKEASKWISRALKNLCLGCLPI
jgi:speckle-type POZ protein